MLEELRHVMEVNPTSLYEPDYNEFKKTGLLNPTREEMRVWTFLNVCEFVVTPL